MIETIDKILNFEESINNVKPVLISGFANFYGAENLEEIENKINNTPIALKMEEEFINNVITKLKLNELNEYILNNLNNREVLHYINTVILRKSIKENRLNINYLEKLKYSEDEEDIKTYNEYKKLKKEFNRIQTKYQEINKIVNKYIKSIKIVKEKYNIEYQNKVKDILLNHTNIPVDKIMDNLELFTGKDFLDIPLSFLAHQKDDIKILDQFENDMLFPNEMLIQEIDELKKEYFSKVTDKDLNVEEYYTNEETKKLLLPEKILFHLEKVRNKTIANYYKIVIDILSLLTSKENIKEEFYSEYANSKSSEMNFRPNEKFVIINIYDIESLNNIDDTIIHELNHLIELKIQEENDKEIIYTAGWNKYAYNLGNNEIKEINNNRYNYINDGINDLISKDILNQIKEKNQTIFTQGNLENSTYCEILLKEFYEEYKEEIIESRKEGDINIIIDKVGKNNFSDLNNLINDYNKYFQGTKPTTNLINKKDEILKNMTSYSKGVVK